VAGCYFGSEFDFDFLLFVVVVFSHDCKSFKKFIISGAVAPCSAYPGEWHPLV
jgi:hypothetical protein